MPAIENNVVWSQELQVHWPRSWRFLSAREILLEAFRPKVFSVNESTIFIRFGEDQDIRVSQHGLHFRILTLANVDKKVSEVFGQVLRIVEPSELRQIEASYSHVRPVVGDYNRVRSDTALKFYGPWISDRDVEDYALNWDEKTVNGDAVNFQVGVVGKQELIDRIARASASSLESLNRRTPAWMRVRMPDVALFTESRYISNKSLTFDAGREEVPQIWRAWREMSDRVFGMLTEVSVGAKDGEAL